LGDDWSEQSCHHPGNIHFHIREWFDEREPNGYHRLHADGNQCRWLNHSYANRYRKHDEQTSDQLFHS
jgi:hypothetical protein